MHIVSSFSAQFQLEIKMPKLGWTRLGKFSARARSTRKIPARTHHYQSPFFWSLLFRRRSRVQHNAFQGHRRPANQSVSIFDRCLLKKNMYHFPKKAIAGRAGSEVPGLIWHQKMTLMLSVAWSPALFFVIASTELGALLTVTPWARATSNVKKPQTEMCELYMRLDLRFLLNKTENFLVSVIHLFLRFTIVQNKF